MIQTPEDWWNTVDDSWNDILKIFNHVFELHTPAHETPGDSKSRATGRDMLDEVFYLKERRDSKLARYFHAAWGLASDTYAHSVSGWGSLCDLCSEEWALYEHPV